MLRIAHPHERDSRGTTRGPVSACDPALDRLVQVQEASKHCPHTGHVRALQTPCAPATDNRKRRGLRSTRRPVSPARMRAGAELAWLTGAGEVAPVWIAAFRITVASGAGASALAELRTLDRLIAPTDAAVHPAPEARR